MALQKEKILSDWTSGNYWRFSSINYNEVIDWQISNRFDLTLWKDDTVRNTEGSVPMAWNWTQYNYSTTTDLNNVTVESLWLDNTATVKDVIKTALYKDIKARAAIEASKQDDDETKNHSLAWFADALDV